MIPWWWLLITWVIGELMGFMTIIICIGRDTAEERERKALENMKLIYPEEKQTLVFVPSDKYNEFVAAREKKAADAGTSTAARETGGKD